MEARVIKVGVVGSRRRNTAKDKQLIKQVLQRQIEKGYILHLVSGGCPEGADKFAQELAIEFDLRMSIHYPDKKLLPDYASYYDHAEMYYARNTLIANECDILIALPHSDRKGGTENTIKKVDKQGKPVLLL